MYTNINRHLSIPAASIINGHTLDCAQIHYLIKLFTSVVGEMSVRVGHNGCGRGCWRRLQIETKRRLPITMAVIISTSCSSFWIRAAAVSSVLVPSLSRSYSSSRSSFSPVGGGRGSDRGGRPPKKQMIAEVASPRSPNSI